MNFPRWITIQFNRPSGTAWFPALRQPSDKSLGYSQMPLRGRPSMQPMDLSEAQALALQQALASGAARPKIRMAPLPEYEG